MDFPLSFRPSARSEREPESITTSVSMDSGLARRRSRPGMTTESAR